MRFVLLFCTFLGSFSVFATGGHDTGGGGIGVPVDGKIYLYDFIEGGVEENSYIEESRSDEMRVLPDVEAALPVPAQTQLLLAAKLNEIYAKSPDVALSLKQKMSALTWRLVRPALRDTDDLGQTPIRSRLERRQIAVRDDRLHTVTIDRQYFNLMPVHHQVGLFLHEIIYALAGGQDSYTTRTLVAYIFSPTFARQTPEQFIARARLTLGDGQMRTYEAYNFINSPAFPPACRNATAEVRRNLHSFFAILHRNALSAEAARRCMSVDYTYETLHLDNIYYTIHILPGRPNRFVRRWLCYSTPAPFQTMSNGDLAQLQRLSDEITRQSEAELLRLHGACFDPETRNAIDKTRRL